MRLSRYLIAAVVTISTSVPGWTATYYVAPQGTTTSPTADGSKTKPWGSVNAALKAVKGAVKVVKGGDTLFLMDGQHGDIKIYNLAFDSPVTIRSMNGKKAHIEGILLNGTTRNFVFRDLSVWSSNLAAVQRRTLIDTGSSASNITFDSLDIRSALDAYSYPTWTIEDWGKHNQHGVLARGSRTQIINNKITGIHFGIQTLGDDALIANNTVSGFAGDGLRALGHNSIVRNNMVTDCVQINDNHADGFQSWKGALPVNGLVVEGNKILEWSNQKISPLRCKLQGIGLFDGPYENLVIQNNIVSVSPKAYHGISVYGVRKAKIVNNTVVAASGNPASSPWLGVFPLKGGAPSTDVIVANNIAMSFRGTSNPTNRVVSSANTVITYPAAAFSSVTTFNYIPTVASGFIDTGDMTNAPKADIMGTPRPVAKGPDRGAFEVQSSSTMKATSTKTAGCSATSPTPCTSTAQAGSTSGAKFLQAP